MKNKKPVIPTFIQKEDELWQLYKKLGRFAQQIDQLPDAAEARKEKRKSAPPGNTPMIF